MYDFLSDTFVGWFLVAGVGMGFVLSRDFEVPSKPDNSRGTICSIHSPDPDCACRGAQVGDVTKICSGREKSISRGRRGRV